MVAAFVSVEDGGTVFSPRSSGFADSPGLVALVALVGEEVAKARLVQGNARLELC
ncbi:hypothetical protein ABZ612_33905 [Streptomyces avermitilis]|uniref:hypothetical protein n=1 Tax=Streptomyces avermitilis TaxID=33903 RepID=UPI0033DE9C21